jgi:hypothetical protein
MQRNNERVLQHHISTNNFSLLYFSNVFYAVKLVAAQNQNQYKALCCWLNSTPGLLLILSNREETEGAWGRLKLSHWRLQNILDISKLNEEAIEALSKIFDRYDSSEMVRLPQQYNPENIDPLRLNFDKEVLGALGIKVDYEPLQELYKMIYESFTQWFALGKARVKTNKQTKIPSDYPSGYVK